MSDKIISNTAPGANQSLIASMVAFLGFMLAHFTSTWSAVPMIVAFLIAPSIAFIAGVIAVYYAIKSLQFIHHNRAVTADGVSTVAGKKRSITAMVIGALALIISLFVIIVFSMLAYDKRAVPNEPIGESEISFFGNDQNREFAVQSILIPDAHLLTSGYKNPYDSTETSSSVIMKSDLDGNEIWTKQFRGTKARLALLNDSTVITCRITPYPKNEHVDRDSLIVFALNFNGDILDTVIIKLGTGASVASVQPLSAGGAVVIGVSDKGEGEYKGRSYLFRTDGQFGKQSLRTFPKNLTGYPSGLAVDSGGNVIFAGFTDEKVTDSLGVTSENRSWALTKISKDGDLIWNKPNQTEPDILPSELKITADGDMYLLGQAAVNDELTHGKLLKLDAEGEIIWSRRVTSEAFGDVWATSMAERPDGWIVTGWLSKRESYMKPTTRLTDSWMTYFISLVDLDGVIEHEFHGGRVRFEPWGITSTSDNTWILTGWGSHGETRDHDEVRQDDNIALMRYSYNP